MITITATEMARQLRAVLDRVEFRGESVTVVRNKREIARIVPGAQELRAREAFMDIQGLVGEEAAATWYADSRNDRTLQGELRDPWNSSSTS